MNLHIICSGKVNPCENLALEEYLGKICGREDVWLYLWQNADSVIIGRNQNPWRECRVELLKKDGVTLVRRNSGGGAVFHDLGNLNFTFIASSHLYNLEKQLRVITDALSAFDIFAEFSGRNDILVNGRKFSGNAFTHKKNISIQHGTLLINSDMERLGHYLTASKAKLQSKGVASVRSRVCNLRELCPRLTVDSLKKELCNSFERIYGQNAIYEKNIPSSQYTQLIEKFSSEEWNYTQSPSFTVQFETRFDWGEVQLQLTAEHGQIERAQFFSDALDCEFILGLSARLEGAPFSPQGMAGAIRAEKEVFQTDAEGACPQKTWLKEVGEWLASLEI